MSEELVCADCGKTVARGRRTGKRDLFLHWIRAHGRPEDWRRLCDIRIARQRQCRRDLVCDFCGYVSSYAGHHFFEHWQRKHSGKAQLLEPRKQEVYKCDDCGAVLKGDSTCILRHWLLTHASPAA